MNLFRTSKTLFTRFGHVQNCPDLSRSARTTWLIVAGVLSVRIASAQVSTNLPTTEPTQRHQSAFDKLPATTTALIERDRLSSTDKQLLNGCPSITNSETTTIRACSGQFVNGLEVITSALNPPYLIDFVRFDSPQVNPYLSTGGEPLVKAYPWNGRAGLADITFPKNTGNTARVHYVYACLYPKPTDPACQPFALITVIVSPQPLKCVPLTVQKTRVGHMAPR